MQLICAQAASILPAAPGAPRWSQARRWLGWYDEYLRDLKLGRGDPPVYALISHVLPFWVGTLSPAVYEAGTTFQTLSGRAQTQSSHSKIVCDKQAPSWEHISYHTDKNRYYN